MFSLRNLSGRQIINLRKTKGWTQEQLARILGVSLNTVQRWEMGRNKPSPLARDKLRHTFNIDSDTDQLELFR